MDGLIIYFMEIREITIQSSSLVSSNKYYFGVIYSGTALVSKNIVGYKF